jgi:hypothetical protein
MKNRLKEKHEIKINFKNTVFKMIIYPIIGLPMVGFQMSGLRPFKYSHGY